MITLLLALHIMLSASVPHTVTLSWDASVQPPPVRAYRVYRNQDNSANWNERATGIKGTEWMDENTKDGRTYYYMIRSVGVDGLISAPSETVKVSIPTD